MFWINVASGQRTNSSVLKFTNVNRNEAGEYRCEASNDCGSAVEAVNVTVQCEYIYLKTLHWFISSDGSSRTFLYSEK